MSPDRRGMFSSGMMRSVAQRVNPGSTLTRTPFTPLSSAPIPGAPGNGPQKDSLLVGLAKQGEGMFEDMTGGLDLRGMLSELERAIDLPDPGQLTAEVKGLIDPARLQEMLPGLQGTAQSFTSLLEKQLPELGQLAAEVKGLADPARLQDMLPDLQGALDPFASLLNGQLPDFQDTIESFTGLLGQQLPDNLSGAVQAALSAAEGIALPGQVTKIASQAFNVLSAPEQSLGSLFDKGVKYAEGTFPEVADGLFSGGGVPSLANAGQGMLQNLSSAFGGGLSGLFSGKKDKPSGNSAQTARAATSQALTTGAAKQAAVGASPTAAPASGKPAGATAGQKPAGATETAGQRTPAAGQSGAAGVTTRSDQLLLTIEQRLAEIASLISNLRPSKAQAQAGESPSADSLRPLAEELGRLAREAAWNEHERRGGY